MNRLIRGIALTFVIAIVHPGQAADEAPADIFQRRIMPIFKSPNPSSCVDCHLGGVQLKDYILPSSEKTFLSLRDQGLVDLNDPDKSRILSWIKRSDDGAALVAESVRQQEFEAFSAWIKTCASDPALRDAPPLSDKQLAKSAASVEVIRHGRSDHVLERFTHTVWAMRFRCMDCHIEGTAQNKKLVAQYGEQVAWMKRDGPEATLNYLRSTDLIDTRRPDQSKLLLKPLNISKHGGGIKFMVGDEGYKAFRAFVEDVAKVSTNQDKTAAALPKSDGILRYGTDVWLKLTDLPSEWGDRLVLARVFAWDEAKSTWEPQPIASTDRLSSGKLRLWQHTLTLQAPDGSRWAQQWSSGVKLPEGRYLIKVYVDRAGRLLNDWRAELGPKDYVGQAEIRSEWQGGYGKMTALSASQIKPATAGGR